MPLSRYRNVNKIKGSDVARHYETVDFPSPEDLEQIVTISVRVSQFDRLDQLAYKHLGAGEYWFIIALMNDLDWMYDFEAGQIIKIPISVEDVLKLM